ncbi:MAG: efflux RND transporter permease subunit, partial [Bacteroidota bacterium]
MRLPKLAIENYQFVLVIVLITLSTGLLSFFTMPRSEDPSLEFPFYNILAVYPGTGPEDMEELVADPIEEALNELEDIKTIDTKIEDGLIIMSVESYFTVDIDEKYDEVAAKVAEVRDQLPAEITRLEVTQFSPLNVKILQTALYAPGVADTETPYNELVDYAEDLEDILEKVDGVRSVDIDAFPEEQVRISLDFEQMAALGIPVTQVLGILQANNGNIPGGDINAGDLNFSLKTSGGYKSIHELKQAVISANGNSIIYLKDIATVEMMYEDETYIGRWNSQNAVYVSVTQKEGYNILQITEELDKEVAAFQANLPTSISMDTVFKQGPFVASRINEFFLNLLQGILLVGVIVLLFLGFRNSLIIMTVIPTSIVIAINVLDLSGFGLQQISIAGLVIALGLLVDNGIVVVENINRYLKDGIPLKEAAWKGTGEVGWAVASSTMTTILAFLPMTQLGGGTGEFIKSLPLTVIFCLIASLLLALSLTPLLSTKFLQVKKEITRTRLEQWINAFIEGVYRPTLAFALKRPLVIILIAIGSFIGSMFLFPYVGVTFFPTADKPLLLVNVRSPEGTSLDRTDQAVRYVESILDTVDYVESYASNTGHGNPKIYYNIQPFSYKKNVGQVLVNLKGWDPDAFYELIDQLRSDFAVYPGAKISVVELKNGPPFEAPIAIRVIGEELDTLRVYARKVEQLIEKIPGTVNIDNPLAISKTNIRTRIKRDKAGMAGVQLSDIDLAVRTAMTGNEIGVMNTYDGDDFPMVVRMAYENEPDVYDFGKVYLPSVTGAQVPLRQLAKLEFEASPAKIDHFDLERTAMVTSDVLDGYNSTEMTLALIDQLEGIELPTGYDFYIAGEFETQQESFGDLGQLLIIAVLGIFAVLILQFKSFRQPFVVLSAIPLAFSGSVFALFTTGFSFSFFAFIGFTSLVGIVVNNSIILVDYTNQLRDRGMKVKDALVKAAETRFTPIILTTMTTICGL